MADLKMTPARLAVLRAIADGQVVHVKPLDIKKPAYDEWEWIPGAKRKVTKDVALLREARLIRPRPAEVRAVVAFRQRWEITDAGRAVLASLNDTEQEIPR